MPDLPPGYYLRPANETQADVRFTVARYWKAGCLESGHVRFGGGQSEKDQSWYLAGCLPYRNATECLEAILTREQATLRQVVATLRAQARAALPAPQPHVPFHQRLSQQRRTRRHLCYEQVVQFAGQGWSRSAIAREPGLHRDTVARYLNTGQFPERAPRPPRPKAVNA